MQSTIYRLQVFFYTCFFLPGNLGSIQPPKPTGPRPPGAAPPLLLTAEG